MILGLDVSTTRIGWAIIDDKQNLIDSSFSKQIKTKASKNEQRNSEPMYWSP